MAGPRIETIDIIGENCVEYTGNRVGTINGRGPVIQHFDARNTRDRKRVDVNRGDRSRQFCLGRRVIDDAAAIEQDKRTAGADRTQVDGRDITAGIVVRGVVVGPELNAALRGQGADQVFAIDSADGVELVLADNSHGQ